MTDRFPRRLLSTGSRPRKRGITPVSLSNLIWIRQIQSQADNTIESMRRRSCSPSLSWRSQLHESFLMTSRNALLVAIPFGLVLLVQFFHLDELVATSRRPKRATRRFCGPDPSGDFVLTDPDGRPVQSRQAKGSPVDRFHLAKIATGARIEAQSTSQGNRPR
jgi:hypothetical protein